MIQGPEGGTQAQAEASSMWDMSDESALFYPVAAIDTVQILMHGYTSYGGLSSHTHYYFLWQLTGKQAAALDEKMDDGDGTKGSVAVEDGADCLIGDWPDLEYDRVNGRCGMLVGAGF